ncbi:hypothetical protein HYH03_013324 [Edaphochlamys debaryana]|uniref:SBP-type domain-containing protein n=1 Tax=Edaphochlamys debaryana TaxID=47281 RepID=A0A835XSI6_9CHLO|nr:hypothetical protein HYH03_013324 [Edaphochlamys debaryana]|eukprot:KAG2488183.1 hypothetical protein HYH03_013324 [Edaphochlamys debaryana]
MPGPGRLREPTPCSDEDGSGQRRGRHASKSLVCVVDGCGEDLTNARKYFQRYRVCERHLKAPQLSMDGRSVRFCDQCSKFHDLSMFEGNRRTCNEKLERTRQARSDKRKQQWQVQQRYNHRSRPDPLSVELLDRELPMKRPFVVDMAGAGEPVDTVGAGLLDPYLGGGLAVGAGLLPPAKLGRLMPGALPPALGGPLAGVPGSPLGPITDLGGLAGDPLIGPPPRDTLEDARALLALRAGPSGGGVSPLPLGLPSPNFGRTSHPHGLSTDNASSLSSYDAHTEVPLRMDSVSSPGALASATAAAVAAAGGVDALLPSRAAAAAAARRAIALGLGPSGVPQGRGLADAAGLGEAQAAADLLASGRGSRTGMGLAEGIGVGPGMGLGGGLAGGPTAAELLAAGQPDLLAAALDAQGALGRNGGLAAVLRAAGNGGSGAIGATSRLVTAAAAAAREQLLLRQAMAAEDAGPGGLAPLRLGGDGGRGGGGLRIHPSVGVDEDGPLVVQRPSATGMRDLRDGLGGRDAMPLPLRSRSEPDRPGGSSAAATLAALGRLEAAAAAELLASRLGDPRSGGGGGRPSTDGGLSVPGRGGGGMSADDLSSAVAAMRRIESRSGSGSGSASAAMTVLASPGIDGDGPWQDASGPPQRQASGDRSQPPSAPSNRPSPRPSPTVPRPLAPPPVPSIKEEQVPMGRAGDTSGDPLISAAARRTSRDGGMADRMDGGAGAAAAGRSQRERDLLSDLASLASSLRANRSPRATGNGLTVDVRGGGGGGLAAPGGRYGSPRDPPLEDAPPPRYAASPRDGPSPRVSDVGMPGGPLMRALAAAASARDGGGGSGGIGSGLLAALAAGGLKQEPGLGGGGGGGGVSFRDHDRPASASGGGYDGAGAAAAAVGGGAATADEIRMLRMLQERLAASGLALVRRQDPLGPRRTPAGQLSGHHAWASFLNS